MRPARTALAILLVAAGCSRDDGAWFQEVAAERGLAWTHVRGHEQRYWFPEIMGGGVGLLDLDGDGRLEVYLVQSGDLAAPDPSETGRVFRFADGRFSDVTARTGGADTGYGIGCACGDADEDGDTDLYITEVGPNSLWRNDGGVLREVTDEAGVGDPSWGTSAAWLDHDADGDLDLYIANYVRWSSAGEILCRSPQGGQDYCSPKSYDAPTRDVLYRNEGGGKFRDVSVEAGLGAAFGNGLGVVPGDFDDDGWLDVFVANDLMPNQLWKNRGDGTFVDRALLAGCAVNRDGAAEAGMGTAAIDVEDDGDLDLFVTHLRDETNTLWRNRGGDFQDVTPATGLGAASLPFTGFGTGVFDFDRDGLLDVLVVNGAVTRNRVPFRPDDPYAEPLLLFRGARSDGAPRYEEVAPRGGTATPLIVNGRGAAFGDVDEDGDVDVVVVENGGPVRLLENVAAPSASWIGLSVVERSGRPALGARLWIECGGRRLHRTVESASSYCSSNDPRVFCGLGDATGDVTVTVHWIGGEPERFGPLDAGQLHVLRRESGTRVAR